MNLDKPKSTVKGVALKLAHRFLGYHEPVVVAGPKPLLTEFGTYHTINWILHYFNYHLYFDL